MLHFTCEGLPLLSAGLALLHGRPLLLKIAVLLLLSSLPKGLPVSLVLLCGRPVLQTGGKSSMLASWSFLALTPASWLWPQTL